ncbi:DUF1671-domain-containing protein [Punctularia strigosozonata HHB-11173 SS5]|uniref:DUF1671-domain-containing protein n=1 Tax=Punctularia strigosozonata (strain HHB-11173) TaxID=741275 RepID=UPI0004417929|nr:DUF1671-domain-containing protein [Punctularia strigosozonata HHB-11173 SS5]EIN07686.1 DUF1671-domain-containing protein [Punctularia strigosozonata HHB-11173 SS5]
MRPLPSDSTFCARQTGVNYGDDPDRCQICSVDLSKKRLHERQAHYETHFGDESQRKRRASKPPGHTPTITTKSVMPPFLRPHDPTKENVFWYPAHSRSPPPNFTPGLIPVLKRALLKSHAQGKTQRAVLCYERAVHVATENWDMGWGCGYRNFLMACAALMDQPFQQLYWPIIDAEPSPGVRNLQTWIEAAWKQGYDADGADQLKHKLVGTSKWIGTAELYVALISRGIPAQLVDFDLTTTPRGVSALLDWIQSYFTPPALPANTDGTANVADALRGAAPVVCTDRMPLVLQHAGHSRTVVGYELARGGEVRLLIFDPSRKPKRELRQAGLESVPPRDALAAAAAGRAVPPPPTTTTGTTQTGAPSSSKGGGKRRHIGELMQMALHPLRGAKKPRTAGSGGGSTGAGMHDAIVVDASDGEDIEEVVEEEEEEEVQFVGSGASGARLVAGGRAAVDALEPAKVLNMFRFGAKDLRKKNKYQVLYFPMTDPLDERARKARRVITSEVGC